MARSYKRAAPKARSTFCRLRQSSTPSEEKFLVVAYQLSGSDSVSLELQHKSSAGDWQLLLSDSGPHANGTLWQNASVVVPAGTVGLRLLANVTNELDTGAHRLAPRNKRAAQPGQSSLNLDVAERAPCAQPYERGRFWARHKVKQSGSLFESGSVDITQAHGN